MLLSHLCLYYNLRPNTRYHSEESDEDSIAPTHKRSPRKVMRKTLIPPCPPQPLREQNNTAVSPTACHTTSHVGTEGLEGNDEPALSIQTALSSTSPIPTSASVSLSATSPISVTLSAGSITPRTSIVSAPSPNPSSVASSASSATSRTTVTNGTTTGKLGVVLLRLEVSVFPYLNVCPLVVITPLKISCFKLVSEVLLA